MSEKLTPKQWLQSPPDPSEIRVNEDGSFYLPIEVVKSLLDRLDKRWSTRNFKHQVFKLDNGVVYCTGSVELWIPVLKRTIVGSATFDVQKYYPNLHWGATCLSLCIVSASQNISPRFGSNLNRDLLSNKINEMIDSTTQTTVDQKIIDTVKGLTNG